ncbi:conserved hypothetical protein [Ricinus communis]|uniref:Retrotransposon Copia-like N-terminal domain-containing protein n=1 Tax=Ricinus communis TaxID=3988 RepID=B9ST98_RICCO|nr:conserved hypothetical protein [Ricinus communis]
MKWEVKDAHIMSWILRSMEPSILLNLKPYKTSREMWGYLKKFTTKATQHDGFNWKSNWVNSVKGADYNDIVCASIPPEGLIAIQSVHETSKHD